jgi:hypothetical protein
MDEVWLAGHRGSWDMGFMSPIYNKWFNPHLCTPS